MTSAVRNLLQAYDSLPEPDKRELVAEILRRSVKVDFAPLSEEDLLQTANDLFLELDQREAGDAGTSTR